MKRIANFIVEHNKFVLLLFCILTAICAICSKKVTTNNDMTKYLPDDSSMKQGMDIMEEEFTQGNTDTSIRIMFQGLSEEEKTDMMEQLEAIKYVDSVSYDAESEEYNKGDYTKYVITTGYEYGTDEETSVEQTINTDFNHHDMVMVVDDTAAKSIPKSALILAFGILIFILLVMSESWIEPLLFVITIVMAIIMNLGTNLLLGTVSSTTSSIGPILQLVLSMDYSIILMNRYHQELNRTTDKKQAMKTAWSKAFNSIFSSSLTTVVGLLTLVFMSFKIGKDLGLVLAKGVFISVICVLTVLPGLILIFTPIILRTEKKVPVIPTKGLAKFSHRFGKVLTVVFVILFGVTYLSQQKTELVYNMPSTDEISEIFPKKESAVLLYDNKDEDVISEYTDNLKENSYVDSITSYSETIATECTVNEFEEKLEENGTETSLSPEIVGMLYYHYFNDGKVKPETVSDFIYFLADDVVNSDTFSEQLSKDTKDSIQKLKKYADAEKLKEAMTIKEISQFMEIEEEQCKKIFLYYYIQKGKASSVTMSVPEFFDYVLDDLANSEQYSSMFSDTNLSSVKEAQKYTNASEMTRKNGYQEMADTLNLDKTTARMVYASYFSEQNGFSSGKMTVTKLVDFLKKDIVKSDAFADKLGKDTVKQIDTLSKFTNKKVITKSMTASELSELFGIEKSTISQIMKLDTSYLRGKTMTLKEFTGFLISDVMNNPEYASYFDKEQKQKIIALDKQLEQAGSSETYNIKGIASALKLDESLVTQVFALKFADKNRTMTPQEFTEFVLNNMMSQKQYASKFDASIQKNLKFVNNIMNATISGKEYNANTAAELLGMDKSTMKLLFAYHKMADGTDKVSIQNMVNYLVNNGSSSLGNDTASTLGKLQKIINASVQGKQYSYSDMASVIGMEKESVRKLYLIQESENSGVDKWKISVQKFVGFLSAELDDNEEIAANLEKSNLDTIESAKVLVDAVVSEKTYSSKELYKIINGFNSDMNRNTLDLLYLYHDSIYYGDSEWKLSMKELVDYIVKELYADDTFSEFLDEDIKSNLNDVQEKLNDAESLLRGKNYSRMLLSVNNLNEMSNIEEFYDGINADLDGKLQGNYYLIGDSAMSYEMSHRFDTELTVITLLTAVAIFIVVAVSFKNLALPSILVLLVQCGVYITVTIIGMRGSGLYYLTLLMVECILMGSTIDYGILFSTYYREERKRLDKKESLINAYRGSIHTIMTSGSILVIVTGVLSQYFPDPSTAQICQNISIGALCASLLILFILPGVLVTADRFVVRKQKNREKKGAVGNQNMMKSVS